MTKDFKSLSLISNAKLAQIGECQIRMAGVLGSIPTVGNFFNEWFVVAFPMWAFNDNIDNFV